MVVALVFVLGVAVGALASRARHQRDLRELLAGDAAATRTQLLIRALDRRLALTDEQRNRAEALLQAQEQAYRAAIEPCRPPIRVLRDDLVRDLEITLTPDQHTALERFVRQRQSE